MPTRQGSADGESDHGDQRTPDRTRPEPEHPAGTERTSSPGGPQESSSTRDGGPANGTSKGGSPENSNPENSSPENSTPEARTPEARTPEDGVPEDGAPGDGAPANVNGENGSGEDGTWAQGQARRTTRTDSAKLAGRASAEAAVAAGEATTSASARAPDLTAAAFFDVDNTMMMGASLFHFARGLAARKFFTASDLAGFAWQQLKFRVGGREDPHDVQSSSEQALSFVAGRKVRELVDLSEEIYDELMADRIWAGTRALAEHHLERGQRVWLVTATPVELAQIIARRLGLTGALGTVAESARGVYTGRLVGEMLHGRAKAHAVRALAASEGLDLRRCTAYSDSANDVPMLSAVGTAVAVNPDQRLRDVARARGWEVRDFRTGRKAARIGVHSALGAGAVAGAVAAGLAYRRREHF